MEKCVKYLRKLEWQLEMVRKQGRVKLEILFSSLFACNTPDMATVLPSNSTLRYELDVYL